MDSKVELARTAAKGVTHLFIGKIGSRIAGMLGGLILIRLLTPEDYGLIAIATVAPGIFGLLGSFFGVGPALIKHLAECKSKGEFGALRQFAYSGFIFSVGISSFLMVVSYSFANEFASVVLGKSYMTPLIQVASLSLLTSSLYFFAESVLVGLEAMRTYAILMVIYESLTKILPILLLVLGWGVWGALFGMMLAGLITGLVGVLASFIIVARTGDNLNSSIDRKTALNKMIVYGIPLGITDLLYSGLGKFYGFMIAVYCIPSDIGNYNAANRVFSALSYLTYPISTVLFPVFSKIDPKKELDLLTKVYVYCIKYSSFLVLPAVVLLMVMAKPLTVVLLGAQYENAWFYLKACG